MSTRVCGRCRRPLPAPASEGAAPAPCPFCAAQDAGRAGGRAQPSRSASPREDAGASKKRAEAFASALSENATRKTPVHSFAVPPEAIPVVNQPRRRDPPPPTPPPVVLTPPPAPVVTILPPAPQPQPPPAPPPRRAAAVTATLASLGPGPLTPQARPSGGAPPATAVASAPGASVAVAFAEVPVVAPSAPPAPAPYLVSVPTPAPVAAAPVAKASTAASLAETMLAFSPSPAESHRGREPQEAPRSAPPEVDEAPRASASAPAASPAAPRGADAWNISSYLNGAEAPAVPITAPEIAPAPGTISETSTTPGSEPVDLQIRSGLPALLHRLSGRGFGVAAAVALLVVAISVGAFVLFGGTPHSSARKSPETAASVSAPAGAPRVAAAPAPSPRLPSLVMPSIADPPAAPSAPSALRTQKAEPAEKAAKAEKAEKIAKAERVAPAREPELAPPPVEKEAPRAPAPARAHAHVAAKSKAVSKHATHHASASSGHGGSHRRTTAHASASESSAPAADDSDKMARARDAYREGNEKLFSGDAAGAITAYEEMVRLNPKDPAGYRGLGLASAQLGKRTEAVRYLRAYLKHAPNADDRGIIIGRISLLQTLPP